MINLDTGNTAFMLIATSLVMLMTPGLAFFYGGLVGRKNVLAIMIQSFISMGWTTMLWFIFGYSLCFSGNFYGIIGNLDQAFLRGVDLTAMHQNGFPILIFIAYQMMFAIITPALITGAFANRINFKAYLIFLTFWLLFVYFPICHMTWGNGGLFQSMGILDFAGGTVVHATAGFAALASVLFIGKRKTSTEVPHNVPFVALGAGLLWFGWYGFNAGSELAADKITALAFLNTDLAASSAAVAWLFLAWIFEKKPKFIGLLTGAIAGLVAVTPAAGFVSPASAFIIGIISAIVCYLAITVKNKLKIDDALDVWGVHGVGGVVGCIMLGLFSSLAVNSNGANGLLLGDFTFFIKESLAVLSVALYSFVFSYLLLWLMSRFILVRTRENDEENGLDLSLHGEAAYEQ